MLFVFFNMFIPSVLRQHRGQSGVLLHHSHRGAVHQSEWKHQDGHQGKSGCMTETLDFITFMPMNKKTLEYDFYLWSILAALARNGWEWCHSHFMSLLVWKWSHIVMTLLLLPWLRNLPGKLWVDFFRRVFFLNICILILYVWVLRRCEHGLSGIYLIVYGDTKINWT